MKYTQHPPYCVSVCLHTGCNLQCDFCGINAVQSKPMDKYSHAMTMKTAERIAKSIAAAGWNSRIEFGAYGESTLNPNWLDIIALFRKHNPKNQILLLTNGGPMIKTPQRDLLAYFVAGGTKLGLEHYKHVKIFDKIHAKLNLQEFEDLGVRVLNYPQQKEGNPHLKDNKRALIFVQDLTENETGTHSVIINMAGSAGPLDPKRNTHRCAHPFRKIIFRSTGEVPICCNDWMGEYKVSNINEEPDIEKIWQSKPFQAARAFMYHGLRSQLRPCHGCNAFTYRNGLLPDGRGQAKLPRPTRAQRALVAQITSKGPHMPLTPQGVSNLESMPVELKRRYKRKK